MLSQSLKSPAPPEFPVKRPTPGLRRICARIQSRLFPYKTGVFHAEPRFFRCFRLPPRQSAPFPHRANFLRQNRFFHAKTALGPSDSSAATDRAAIGVRRKTPRCGIYPTGRPNPSPCSLSRGYRNPTRGNQPRRHGSGVPLLGSPLIGFPSAGQPTGLSSLPFLIFW